MACSSTLHCAYPPNSSCHNYCIFVNQIKRLPCCQECLRRFVPKGQCQWQAGVLQRLVSFRRCHLCPFGRKSLGKLFSHTSLVYHLHRAAQLVFLALHCWARSPHEIWSTVPWYSLHAVFYFTFSHFPKTCAAHEHALQEYLTILGKYMNYTVFYTDDSKTATAFRCAIVQGK